MMCLDLYYYLGIKITIFLRPSSSFKFTIPFGGRHYKYLVLFHYLFRLIETLFFYGAIYKKKTHYVLLILNQNWALVILCGRGEGAHLFNMYFLGCVWKFWYFFGWNSFSVTSLGTENVGRSSPPLALWGWEQTWGQLLSNVIDYITDYIWCHDNQCIFKFAMLLLFVSNFCFFVCLLVCVQ